MEIRQFRPSTNATNPFQASGASGSGPSSSDWDKRHLEWLAVDFSDEWPLFAALDIDGVLPETFSLSSEHRVAINIRDEFGWSWVEIQSRDSLPPHYETLIDLFKDEEPHIVLQPSSSVVPESSISTRNPGSENTSPPLSTGPRHHTIESTLDPRRSSSPYNPDSSPSKKPANIETREISPSTLPTVRLDKRLEVPSQTRDNEPLRKRSAPSSGESSASDSADTTYNLPTTPDRSKKTQDKDEEYTVDAARACLRRLRDMFRALEVSPELMSVIENQRKLNVMVEGLVCNCKTDVSLKAYSVLARESIEKGKFGEIHGECKRLEHKKTFERILGQEVASLLSLAALKMPKGGQRMARSDTKRLRPEPKRITTYLFSWHHLTGYVTSLSIQSDDLGKVNAGPERDSSERTPDLLRGIEVKRSRKMNLTDSKERVMFVTAMAAIVLEGLSKHTVHRHVIDHVRNG